MKHIFYYCLALTLFVSCKKENNSKVEIYMLKSFTLTQNQATNPNTVSISNAVLADTTLVADRDIEYYIQSTTTFKLNKDIKPNILAFSAIKGFAVTVNKQVIYYGIFHPAYLSSITFGLATIDPILLNKNELKIQFATITGNPSLLQLDKRNDIRIINSLKVTRRVI